MKSVVIVQDHMGYTQRVLALKAAHPNVIAVTPWDKPHPHCLSFRPPEEWLPSFPDMSFKRKCYYKADSMGLAALLQHAPPADYYWFIESDVVASQERWKAFFADHENNPADCLCGSLRMRHNTLDNDWWRHEGTPAWTDCYFIMAVYRLSAAAVRACIAASVEMRNCFCELTIGSVTRRAGLTVGSVNERQTHWNTQTFKATPGKVILNRDLINHPVKKNSYDI